MEVTRVFDLLDWIVEKYPKADTLAGKHNGEWTKYSANEYYKLAHLLSYGLCEIGLEPGDKVITISNNCPEWNFMDMALAMSGLIHVPIYPTLSSENYQFIFDNCEAKVILISTPQLYKRIRIVLEKTDRPITVYTLEPIQGVKNVTEILHLGIENRSKNEPIIQARKESIKPDDFFTLIYTSGTTGDPKGVMLSHRNIVFNFIGHSKVQIMTSEDRVLSFLPLCHIYERSLNYHFQYLGISIYYAENLGTIAANMAEIHANGFCSVPRIMEVMYDKLYSAGKDLPPFKKFIYFAAFKHGLKYDHVGKSLWYKMWHKVFEHLVYSKWRNMLGGNKMTVISGSSAIQERMIRLFSAAGISIYEGYGMSETSPVISVNNPRDGFVKIGTVGPVLEGVEIKFSDDGEILTRGPHVMLGYYKDPEYTAKVLDKDGWFHTGDIGKLVDGIYLKLTDRKKEIFKLSAGKYIAPQLIENKFRESMFIEQIMVIGENEKFASALIIPNFNHLHYWAFKYKLHYRDNNELINLPEVQARIQKEIDLLNKSLAPHEQIKRFRLLTEEWSTQNGFLSPTLKLRRNVLLKKYQSLINDIYNHDLKKPTTIKIGFKQIDISSIQFSFKQFHLTEIIENQTKKIKSRMITTKNKIGKHQKNDS